MAGYRYTFVKFLRDWMLIIGMLTGAGAYLAYHALPALHGAGPGQAVLLILLFQRK